MQPLTEEEEQLASQLALLGIGIWSKRAYNERTGHSLYGSGFAIVTIESVNGDGDYFLFPGLVDPRDMGWFDSYTEAATYALKRMGVIPER